MRSPETCYGVSRPPYRANDFSVDHWYRIVTARTHIDEHICVFIIVIDIVVIVFFVPLLKICNKRACECVWAGGDVNFSRLPIPKINLKVRVK